MVSIHCVLLFLLSCIILLHLGSCETEIIIFNSGGTTSANVTTSTSTTKQATTHSATTTTSTTGGTSTTGAVKVCGNGVVDAGEQCDDTNPCCNITTCQFKNSSSPCRASKGVCDIVEYCTGTSSDCPTDVGQPATHICSPADPSNVCSIASVCAGSIANCTFAPTPVLDKCGVCGGDNSSCLTGGVCGDTVCSSNESCKICAYDCGFCNADNIANACSKITCSGRGYCTAGECTCSGNYTGSNCEIDVSASKITALTSTPVANIQPTSNESQVQFSISVSAVNEVTYSGASVRIYPVVIGNNIASKQTTDNGSTTVTYTISLSNGAYITATLFYSDSSTAISFANQNYTLLPNTLKTTVAIFNWPWVSSTNQLQVVYTINGVGTTSTTVLDSFSGTAQFYHYQVDNTLLLGKFLSYALVDGKQRPTIATIGSAGEIVMTIPHFVYYAVLDPDFSTSIIPPTVANSTSGHVAPQNTHSKSGSKKPSEGVIIGVVIGIILAIVITIFSLLLVRVYKMRQQTKVNVSKAAGSVARRTNADRGGVVRNNASPRYQAGQANRSSHQGGSHRSSGSGRSGGGSGRSGESGSGRSKHSSESSSEDMGGSGVSRTTAAANRPKTASTSPRREDSSTSPRKTESPRRKEDSPPRTEPNKKEEPKETTLKELEEGSSMEMSNSVEMTPL